MENLDNSIIPNNPLIPLTGEEEDQFPIGLKILVIDANIVCLRYLVQLLQKCRYKVTAMTEAAEAIRLLKEEKQTFDLVITDVVGHDMDGFKILQIVGVGMDIPVVIVSANEELDTIKRGIMEGAEDYLLKPVRLQELKNIWQHVLRKRTARKRTNPNLLHFKQPEDDHHDYDNNNKRVAINQQDYDYSDDITDVANCFSKKKKQRVSWTMELHEKFVQVYEQLGEKERVPNNILKLMNDPNLTRENVASHLQKHRDTLRKKKASGAGKLGNQKILSYDHRNPTNKGSTMFYNSMNHHINKVSNLGPQFQFPNGEKSSPIEQQLLQGNQNPRSTWTATGSSFPVPEFNWSNFSSNYYSSVSKSFDDHNQQFFGGFGANCLNNDHSLEINQNFGAISDQATSLAWPSFPNNTAGHCSPMQFNTGNSRGSLLTDDDIDDIFKQFQSEGAF